MLNDIIMVGSTILRLKSEMILLDRNASLRVAGIEEGSERIRARTGGRSEIEKKQEENC